MVHMTRSKVIIIACCAVVGVLALAFVGAVAYREGYNRTAPILPAYPNATNVQRTPVNRALPEMHGVVTTTYETVDSHDAVVRYYTQQLTRPGWQHWDVLGTGSLGADFIRRTCPTYLLFIETTPTPSGTTGVSVKITMQNCFLPRWWWWTGATFPYHGRGSSDRAGS